MFNRLSFRLSLPIVLGALLVWGFLTVFVLGAIDRFTQERLGHDLKDHGRIVTATLDNDYDLLAAGGKLADPEENRIARGRAVGRLEKLLRSNDLSGVVLDAAGEVLASFAVPAPSELPIAGLQPNVPTAVRTGGDTGEGTACAYLMEFPLWGLRVILLETGAEYAHLAGSVRTTYLGAGGIIILALAMFLLYSQRAVARPVADIAGALKRGERPAYRGIEEFTALSESFRTMMDSLDARDRQVRLGQSWYRQMYEAAPVMFFSMTPAGLFSDVNTRLACLSGHPRGELAGQPVSLLFSFHTGDLASLWTDSQQNPAEEPAAPRASEMDGIPARMHTASGATLQVLMNALRTVDPEGNRVILTVVHDVTTSLRTERELIAARDAAQEAYKAKSEFLANVSHEIRTPLNGVLGMLQLLEKTHLDDRQHGYVGNALECGRSFLALLGDILDYSSLDAGRLRSCAEPCSPAFVLEEVMQLFAREAAAKNVELTTHIDPGLPRTLMGDAGRLRQVLFNLVGNAVKFTSQGHVALRVDVVRTAPETGWLLLFQVEDTGIGIPQDTLPTLFEPFIQADGSHSRRYQGAGLGLAIVKRLVALWDGVLEIDSLPDQGTTVSFTFPADPAPEGTTDVARPEQADALEPRPGGKVLLAEDDPINTFMTMDMLENLGYRATIVDNGRDALKALAQDDFDCLLMDIQMPVMDGLAATRAIRAAIALGEKARIPIVALTAHALPGDRERFLAAGMDEYLSKPVEYDNLAGVLARAMRKPWRQRMG